MKQALSIRYGGVLVSPEDCDYESYLNLGLICPFCKDGVFLVKETKRKTEKSKKSFFVKAHFSHFKKGLLTDVCENRSKSLSKEQVDTITQQGRNQRRKIIQDRLWKIVGSSLLFVDPEEASIGFTEMTVTGMKQGIDGQLVIEEMTKFLDHLTLLSAQQLPLKLNTLREGLSIWKAEAEHPHIYHPHHEEQIQQWRASYSPVAIEMVVSEAIGFLTQKKQYMMLRKLVFGSFFVFISNMSSAKMDELKQEETEKVTTINTRLRYLRFWGIHPIEKQGKTLEQAEKLFNALAAKELALFVSNPNDHSVILAFILDHITQMLCLINWGEQFKKHQQH